MVGYSGTPLSAKLGIKAGTKIHIRGAPDGYLKLLEPLPVGVTTTTRVSNNTALVHVFSSRKAELAKVLRAYRAKLKPTVPVCVS